MLPKEPAWRLGAAAVILAAAILPASASDKTCSPADATKAEKFIDGVTSWAALNKAVSEFGHCDQGRASQLFNEALLRVVIDGWPNIEEADPVLKRNPALRTWTTARLSSVSIVKEDSDNIRDLAKSNCPKGYASLCEYFNEAISLGKPIALPGPMELAKPAAPPAKK